MKTKIGIQTVTPAMASKWLEKNTHNRNMDKARVKNYAADMTRGAWTVGTDAIGICDDGTLLNGQHRLSAVVMSGCSVPMLVMSGLARETQTAMDIGQPRRIEAVLGLFTDIKNITKVASVVRALYEWDYTRWSISKYAYSQTQLFEAVQRLDSTVQPHINAWLYKAYGAGIHSPVTLTAWSVIAARGEPDKASEFMHGVVHGAGPGDARTVLRERLIGIRGEGRSLTTQCRHLTIHAWNAWVRGQVRVSLKTISGSTPKALLLDDVHFGLVPRRSESVSDKEPSA
jgi:hypothetical protein